MKKLLTITVISLALTSCGKWVQKPGPHFAYKEKKANEEKAAKMFKDSIARKQ